MRSYELNVLACMKLVQRLYGVSRQEAKTAVHFSDAWSDRREGHEALHEAASEAVTELATWDGQRAKASA